MNKFYVLGYFNAKDGGIEGEIFPTKDKETNLVIRIEKYTSEKGRKCFRVILRMLKNETKEQLAERVSEKLTRHKKSQNFEKGWNIKEESVQSTLLT